MPAMLPVRFMALLVETASHSRKGSRINQTTFPSGFGRCRDIPPKEQVTMQLKDKIKQVGATGYILLWLLGIPIPILLIIFLLRGCT
jgi:hypothetical protein